MRVRYVEQGHPLQVGSVGQVQGHAIALQMWKAKVTRCAALVPASVHKSRMTAQPPLVFHPISPAVIFRFPAPFRPSTHHNLDALVEILAGCRECLGRCILEVPELVLHPAVEFVRILLPLQVKLDADGGVLGKGEAAE